MDAYSISSRALSTNSAISPYSTPRLRGLEPLAPRSAILCSIQTELQAQFCQINNNGEGGIRTPGRTFQSYAGLANRCLKPARPPLHFFKHTEEVGFEPTNLSVSGFQDRRHRPLGHSSVQKIIITYLYLICNILYYFSILLFMLKLLIQHSKFLTIATFYVF